MKNDEIPQLKIPKNAKTEMVYHYNRSERLALSGASQNIQEQGFFKRYRGLLIIFADIILLVLIYIGFQMFLEYDGRPLENYSFELSAYRIKDKVFALLVVQRNDEKNADKSKTIEVEFSLKGYDSADKIIENLPRSSSARLEIRSVLPSPHENLSLSAKLIIGKKKRELSVTIEEK